MKSSVLIVLLALSTAVGIAWAASPPRVALPAADCIQTTQINEWRIVDNRTAIVRTGPKRYVVKLQTSCPQLGHPPGLIFRASPANLSVNQGRICGDAGETVYSRGQAPCAIESVSKIDKAQFDQLKASAQPRGPSGAAPTTNSSPH